MSEFTLDDEYRAFESLIETKYPELKVLAYTPPNQSANTVVFTLIDSDSAEKNRATVEKLRSYQLLFYFDKQTTAMQYYSKIESLFDDTSSIACAGRFIKISNYSMSRIFDTQSGLKSFYVIIEASYHISRSFDEVPKMASINATINK